MEATAFFEKKVSLNAKDLNKVGRTAKMDDLIMDKLRELLEDKCSEHGFVLPGTLALVSRSMGYFEPGRFTGDAVYYVKASGQVLYPADGVRVIGEVLRKNKMGLYAIYRNALHIQLPRDLHMEGDMADLFDSIQIGDTIEIELKKSLFHVNDPHILTNGLFIAKKEPGGQGEEKKEEEGGEEEKEEEEEEEEESDEEEEEESDEEEEEDDDEEEEESGEEDIEEEERGSNATSGTASGSNTTSGTASGSNATSGTTSGSNATSGTRTSA